MLLDRKVVLASGGNGRFFELTRRDAPVNTGLINGSLKTSAWGIPCGTRSACWGQQLLRTVANPRLQSAYASDLTYADLNPEANNFVRDDLQPSPLTAPANLAKQFWMDLAWWTEHGARAQERWNRWMLQR